MTLILSGTDGLSDVDGSAATPAIRGTDANTGIFFPAADQVAITTGGTQRAVVDASGNLGVGTTSPAHKIEASSSTNNYIGVTCTTDGNAASRFKNNQRDWLVGVLGGASGAWAVYDITASAERARIDSSGNLLVGTTSLSGAERLNVTKDNSGQEIVRIANTSSVAPWGMDTLYSAAAPNGTSNLFIGCRDTGGARFNVRSNGGVANYSANNVNLSDRREKTNFAPAGNYLAKICAIPVQTFNYVDQNLEEDGDLTLGVVAQDVEAVAPELVIESNWGTKEEPKMRLSIYQTDLQYALMKCIQEQQALITTLTDRITALETPTGTQA